MQCQEIPFCLLPTLTIESSLWVLGPQKPEDFPTLLNCSILDKEVLVYRLWHIEKHEFSNSSNSLKFELDRKKWVIAEFDNWKSQYRHQQANSRSVAIYIGQELYYSVFRTLVGDLQIYKSNNSKLVRKCTCLILSHNRYVV